jgi:hypothetical protein
MERFGAQHDRILLRFGGRVGQWSLFLAIGDFVCCQWCRRSARASVRGRGKIGRSCIIDSLKRPVCRYRERCILSIWSRRCFESDLVSDVIFNRRQSESRVSDWQRVSRSTLSTSRRNRLYTVPILARTLAWRRGCSGIRRPSVSL